jgi:uncharacterized protein (TIGR00299 family) protein
LARIVYFDCFSGASGDMILGALLDVGLPMESLRDALGSLAVGYGRVSADRVVRAGVSATKFKVHEPVPVTAGPAEAGHHSHDHEHRHNHEHHHHHHDHHSLKEIAGFIGRSALSKAGKDKAVHLFERLAEAEAAIHGISIDRVHLHEVGALDSIIDIVGAVHGMEWLGADRVVASPLNVGSGTVVCAHGTYPVPAPATARLLAGAPVYAGAVAAELVTPTGALLVTEYAHAYGPMPHMHLEKTGYGAGDRDVPGHPNVLRILVGEAAGAASAQTIVLVECEIDDMNPQLFGPLMDRLLSAGALDVYYVAAQMKKNRPGVLVSVLTPPDRRDAIAGVLFAETTTIGLRYQELQRECLDREIRMVDTPIGPIRFKVAKRAGRVLNAAPEFDDCARAAAERGIPIKEAQAIAMKAWLDRAGSGKLEAGS